MKLGNWAPSTAQATGLSPSLRSTSRYWRMRSASQASSAVPAAAAAVQVDRRLLADLERLPVGQEPELRLVLLARDRQRAVGDDRVAEPVGARRRGRRTGPPARPRPASESVPLAGLRVGRERLARDLALGDPRRPASTRLRTATRQRLAGRLALGVEGRGVGAGTTRRRGRRRGSSPGRSRRPRTASMTVGRRRDVVLRQLRDEPERLLLGEPLGRELDVELAGGVGRAAERSGRRADGRRPAGRRPGRRTGSGRRGRPRSSRRGSRPSSGRSNARSIFSSWYAWTSNWPGELALARLVEPDAVRADRAPPRRAASASWKVPNSESVTGRATSSRPRLSVDFEPVDCARRTLAYWPSVDLADDPAERDLLAGPVGGAVGVDVGAGREPLRHLVGHAQARAGHVGAVEDEVTQRRVRRRAACPTSSGGRRRRRSSPRGSPRRRRRPAPGPRRGPCRSSCPGRRRGPARATP